MDAALNADSLKDKLVDLISTEPFNPIAAAEILRTLKTCESDPPFMEDEIPEGCEYDLLGHVCIFGTIQAVKWVIEERVMGPPDLDISLYTALALADDLADDEVLRYLLKEYGATFSEVCFGDLSPDRQELAIEYGVVEGYGDPD